MVPHFGNLVASARCLVPTQGFSVLADGRVMLANIERNQARAVQLLVEIRALIAQSDADNTRMRARLYKDQD